jgi:hypothetical protein
MEKFSQTLTDICSNNDGRDRTARFNQAYLEAKLVLDVAQANAYCARQESDTQRSEQETIQRDRHDTLWEALAGHEIEFYAQQIEFSTRQLNVLERIATSLEMITKPSKEKSKEEIFVETGMEYFRQKYPRQTDVPCPRENPL